MLDGNVDTVMVSIVSGLVALGFGIRKLYTSWVSDGTITVKEHATQDVVSLLQTQVNNFAAANKELSAEIAALRKTNTDLLIDTDSMRRELTSIKAENGLLRTEIEALRIQIDRLTALLQQRQ